MLGRGARRVVPVLVLTAGLVLAGGPASAHTAFVGASVPTGPQSPSGPLSPSGLSSPSGRPVAPGSVVPVRTAQVVLTFSGDVLPELTAVVVTGPGGPERSLPRPVVRGGAVVQPLPAPLDLGSWTVAYRVVAADGHPLTGAVPFRVAAAPPASSGGPAPGPALTAEPTRDTEPTPATEPTPYAVSRAAPAGTRTPLLPAAGLAAGGGLLGLLLLRRRRTPR